MNESLISLIPKQESPETIVQFRPIALCNVVSKEVTKIIANLLKPLINKLVQDNQTSFMPGKQGIDNLIILQ